MKTTSEEAISHSVDTRSDDPTPSHSATAHSACKNELVVVVVAWVPWWVLAARTNGSGGAQLALGNHRLDHAHRNLLGALLRLRVDLGQREKKDIRELTSVQSSTSDNVDPQNECVPPPTPHLLLPFRSNNVTSDNACTVIDG